MSGGDLIGGWIGRRGSGSRRRPQCRLYWLANRAFDAQRGDFFYLADAFLHGRTWLTVQLGPADVSPGRRTLLRALRPVPRDRSSMPLVLFTGPSVPTNRVGDQRGSRRMSVGMCWWTLGRTGCRSPVGQGMADRLLDSRRRSLWVHHRAAGCGIGPLIATILTFPVWSSCSDVAGVARRPVRGGAFLTRAPLAFASRSTPYCSIRPSTSGRSRRARRGGRLHRARQGCDPVAAVVRSWPRRGTRGLLLLAYNPLRFGTPLESGYALATLPDWLERQRAIGLFSLAHVPMNIDYLLLHLPRPLPSWPFIQPDGLGMSVLLTSPGLLFALRADWRQTRTWWLAAAAIGSCPTLLYSARVAPDGYRYFLDSCRSGPVRSGPASGGDRVGMEA